METVKIEYNGELRTTCTHLQSGQQIITDAPKDNKGKGEAFSPTDLVATAYGSCMLTIIGIYCQNNGLNFSKADVGVKKVMGTDPRRVACLEIRLDLSGNDWSEIEQKKVIAAAKACPVAKSVSETMEVKLNFEF
ncbi:MAG: putative redox protein [Lentimonas sp.]|jgi:putative redox protein